MNKNIPIKVIINLQEYKILLNINPSEKGNKFIELFKLSIIIENGINRNKNVRNPIKVTNKSLETVE